MDATALQMKQRDAEEFAAANLGQCCQELLDWSKTGILCGGYVRKLATMFSHCTDSEIHQLSIAKATVDHLAVEIVANMGA